MLYLKQPTATHGESAARAWLERAGQQGHEQARLHLARLQLGDVSDAASLSRAAATLRELADDGMPEAQTEYGLVHVFGRGLPSDVEEGTFWLKQAALQGYAPAQFNLATLYAQGMGLAPDPVAAYAWLSLAAAHDPAAADALSMLEKRLSQSERPRALALAGELASKLAQAPESGHEVSEQIQSGGP
jgi:TPR repeat protein